MSTPTRYTPPIQRVTKCWSVTRRSEGTTSSGTCAGDECNSMARPKVHKDAAARQKAYRQRKKEEREAAERAAKAPKRPLVLRLEPETVFPEPEPEYRPEVRRGPHSDPPWTLEEFQEREYSERIMPLIAEAHRLEPLAPAAGEPAWRPPKRRRQRWDWRDKFR
jgi:hypothetical protein